MSCKRWDVIKVEVEKSDRDTRKESYKIAGSKANWETLSQNVQVVGKVSSVEDKQRMTVNLCDTSVDVINNAKRSLGIIEPSIIKAYFRNNAKYGELYQQALPGFTDLDTVQTKRDFPQEPRVTYTCPQSVTPEKKHDQQILEWGFYEWIRKNPDNIDQVWENAQFNKTGTKLYFVIGNLFRYRTSFMVISVLRVPIGPITKDMFPWRKLPDSE